MEKYKALALFEMYNGTNAIEIWSKICCTEYVYLFNPLAVTCGDIKRLHRNYNNYIKNDIQNMADYMIIKRYRNANTHPDDIIQRLKNEYNLFTMVSKGYKITICDGCKYVSYAETYCFTCKEKIKYTLSM